MNNKKNGLGILENFDFSNYENDIEIENEIGDIKMRNNVEISIDEAMCLSELINCKNLLNKIHKLTK